ncbi:hypothetical protein HAX54_017542 [Datura stramonium]|uniref:Uncharacterized protein n=1 Tax=Datura stramonium TaxID=4076 RepID=A0ABS8UN69_DATST|nr:hypothetical protein [Datura stramonium]
MEPPPATKMVGRPKVKRAREENAARKGKGIWPSSRKVLLMSCGYCGTTDHNIRKYPLSYGQPSTQPSTQPSGQSFNVQSQPFSFIDEEEEESESILRPKVISKARRLQQRKLLQQPIGIRKINFKGDETGVNVPTKLPFSQKKITWKDKATITSNQLVAEKEKKK